MKIVVIDYGLGNLRSVYNALKFLGQKPKISSKASDIEKADKLILPGVGAFQDAILGLKDRNLIEPIKKAIYGGKPYLGICLGLQILFERSEEGNEDGLGVLKGRVKRFNEKDGIKVPQIGWNKIKKVKGKATLLDGVNDNSYFYFVHSYYGDPEDKSVIAGQTKYGVKFGSILKKNNVNAVQFHPERSQDLGLKVLENFIKL